MIDGILDELVQSHYIMASAAETCARMDGLLDTRLVKMIHMTMLAQGELMSSAVVDHLFVVKWAIDGRMVLHGWVAETGRWSSNLATK